MPSELLDTLLTTTDRELLRTELERLKSALFKIKKDTFPDVLKTQVRVSIAQIIEREIRTQKQEPEKYLAEIEAQLDTIPTLQLTLAFEPTSANIEHIAQHAAELLEQPVILDLQIKPEMIAGTIIVWEGHYHDASLQKKVVETTQKIVGEMFRKDSVKNENI